MSVSRNDVIFAFRAILGREPESEKSIKSHLDFETIESLGQAIMRSQEFQAKAQRTIYSSESKWVATEVLNGFIQWIDLHDRFVSFGCLHNNWEPSESEYYVTKLDIGNTVLDIGANIGWFTLLAARKLGNLGQIHAFEPRPETLKMLKRTVFQNNLSNVTVWPYALSDHDGSLNLVWSKNTDNPGGSFTVGGSEVVGDNESAVVSAVRLDQLLPDIAPDFIKIDVEGAEPRVFSCAKNAIRRRRPPILSELHPAQLAIVSGTTPAQYIEQMEDLGYKCYLLKDGNPTHRLKDFPENSKTDLVSVVFE